MNRTVALTLVALAVGLSTARGQGVDEGELADAPDPFAEDDLIDAPDPFGADAPAPDTEFDPEQVDVSEPGYLEVHGRANLTLGITRHRDPVELFEDDSIELSSVDLYVEWFPYPWVGLVGEVEFVSELEETRRELEVEFELLVLELRPLGDERLRLRIGQSPVPFGLERRYYAPSRNELPNRPAVFRKVYPGTYADLGVTAWGVLDYGLWGGGLELEAGLSKGLEGPQRGDVQDPWSEDTNREPQLAARLGWTLVGPDPQTGSQADGPAKALKLRLTLGASMLLGHYDDDARRRVFFHGFDAELEVSGLRVRFEYVSRFFEVDRAPALKGEGLYLLLAYHHPFDLPLLQEAYVAFRYGRADPDRSIDDEGDIERYHAGLGWTPYEGFRVKASFEYAEAPGLYPKTFFLEIGYAF